MVRPAGKKGKGRLHGTITLVDNKTLCNLKDYEGQNPSGATNKREQKVHTDYISAAKELDKKFHGAQGGQAGPVEQRLCQYGKAGKVHATVFGTFGGASQGVNDLCDLTRTRAPAVLRRHPWPSQSHVRPPDPSPMGPYGNARLGKACY